MARGYLINMEESIFDGLRPLLLRALRGPNLKAWRT